MINIHYNEYTEQYHVQAVSPERECEIGIPVIDIGAEPFDVTGLSI